MVGMGKRMCLDKTTMTSTTSRYRRVLRFGFACFVLLGFLKERNPGVSGIVIQLRVFRRDRCDRDTV